MHILEEWRLRDIEQKADRATNKLWELDSIKSNVDSLEYSLRNLSSLVIELRSQLQMQEVKLELFINESNSL